MNPQIRFSEASERYLPARIRILFIAEAPPAYRVNRLFYFPDLTNGDTLFLEMMKVLYPNEIGYSGDTFHAGSSVRQLRQRKAELLQRFQSDGSYLIDANEYPMPDGADTATKSRLMRGALPEFLERVRRLTHGMNTSLVLIGGVTYSVCAEALRLDGKNVVNDAMINHPARGGQLLFRAKLRETLRKLS